MLKLPPSRGNRGGERERGEATRLAGTKFPMSLDSEFVYVPSAGDRHSSCRCVLRTLNLWTAAATVSQGLAMRERERSGLILNRSILLSSYT